MILHYCTLTSIKLPSTVIDSSKSRTVEYHRWNPPEGFPMAQRFVFLWTKPIIYNLSANMLQFHAKYKRGQKCCASKSTENQLKINWNSHADTIDRVLAPHAKNGGPLLLINKFTTFDFFFWFACETDLKALHWICIASWRSDRLRKDMCF